MGERVRATKEDTTIEKDRAIAVSLNKVPEIPSIKIKGKKNDALLVLSGSGNSKNIINAITEAKKMNIKTMGILGFDGGKCLDLLDLPIHFKVNDMQVSEDLQIIVCHMCMQWLSVADD